MYNPTASREGLPYVFIGPVSDPPSFFFFFAHGPSFARLQTVLDKEAPLVPASACPAEREQSTPVWSAETMILPWTLALGTEPGLIPYRRGPSTTTASPRTLRPGATTSSPVPLPHLIQRRGAVKECGCISPQPVGLARCIRLFRGVPSCTSDYTVCLPELCPAYKSYILGRPPLLVPFLSIFFFFPSLSAAGQKEKKKKKTSHHFSLPLNLSGLMWVLI